MSNENEELDGVEYELSFIVQNPIATKCSKCRRCEPINAPSLDNVRCFWCGSTLSPVDCVAYRDRINNLWRHAIPRQIQLHFSSYNHESNLCPHQ